MKYWNYIKHLKDILLKNRATPKYLVLFVTDRCNARCEHCLLGETSSDPKEELTLAEIEKTAKNMDDLMFLLPTGGEPFLRGDLAEIIKIFYKETNVRNVGIPTNGSLTEQAVKTIEEILSSCPEIDLAVDVSIDGVGRTHDRIRNVPGLFDKAVNTYKELKKLKKRYHNLNVNGEITVSSFNENELKETYDYLTGTLGVDTVITLLTRGRPRNPSAKDFDINKYEEYSILLEEGVKNGALSGHSNFPFHDLVNAHRIVKNRLIARTVRENKYQVPCFAGRFGAAISAKGDVLPCELLPDKAIGNVRDFDYDFRKIWSSKKADEVRAWIRKTKCFCTYECFLTLNILFNPGLYPAILKEWLSIKWSRLSRSGKGK
jgi:radical SAM protein with 4Fe4S-binding SPASM domain